MLLIGNNSMVLNTATVCAVLEKHLNDSLSYGLRATQEVKVSAVKYDGGDGCFKFSVTVEEKPPTPKAA